MENLYKSLGFFKIPTILQNPYGIKIYVGNKDKEDWCIEIPKALAKKKCHNYNCDYNYMVYMVSEKEVLRIAKSYTELAKLKG